MSTERIYEASTFLLSRSSTSDSYTIWKLDPTSSTLVTPIQTATFSNTWQVVPLAGNWLEVSPLITGTGFQYRLVPFDPNNPDPLNATTLQAGTWDQQKFWDYYDYWNCPGQPEVTSIQFVPNSGYVLSYLPTNGRGTFRLWNFDPNTQNPNTTDPLPDSPFDQDALPLIKAGHQLIPMGNYMVDWEVATQTYTVYSFDPMKANPLSLPAISQGQWSGIDATHQLVAVGPYILDWVPSTRAFYLYGFDPSASNPLVNISSGTLPTSFDASTWITGIQTAVPQNIVTAMPGNMQFMRSRVKKVVVYMLESRSFDNVVGWLYENGDSQVNWVNASPPFQGASTSYSNTACGQTYYLSKFHDGQLSTAWNINTPSIDPFHGTPDSIDQQWSGGYSAYVSGQAADMGGFVSNNGTVEVMTTLTPNQLPILNCLGYSFAISDMWFCSAPGGTTTNRAYAASGSAYDITVSYEGGDAYTNFPDLPRRQSMFKVLSNNGYDDWKIYYSVLWGTPAFPYTYHLFVSNQIPSVDAAFQASGAYVQPYQTFLSDAANGTLPKFSWIEPIWFDPSGKFTSYHPTGDIIPGEEQLNEIYNALKNGPEWNNTALIITFSKGGGCYDHVPSPRAQKAWPHDENDGFGFDACGARVPAIVISPLIPANTVFRSNTTTPFDATSLISTVLDWYGIPRARWALGDRALVAPTFETVFQLGTPRTDAPTLTRSYDATYPPAGTPGGCGAVTTSEKK